MAYFTDPMGDEFKKAMEEAFKEMEAESEGSDDKIEDSAQSPKKRKKVSRAAADRSLSSSKRRRDRGKVSRLSSKSRKEL